MRGVLSDVGLDAGASEVAEIAALMKNISKLKRDLIQLQRFSQRHTEKQKQSGSSELIYIGRLQDGVCSLTDKNM